MGNFYQFDDQNKNITLNYWEKMKNENEDFNKIHKIIKAQSLKKNENLIIPEVFHFLKIDSFYLGLNYAKNIYNYYSEEFQKLGLTKNDSVHASFLFNFSDECNYFVDYLPDKCDSEYKHIYKDEDKGVRYKISSIKEFVEKNDICIINLKAHKSMSFYDFFEKICSNEKWIYKNYNLETNNCCHFCLNALKELDAELYTKDKLNDILFTKLVKEENKNSEIVNVIPKLFLNYFNDFK